MGRRKEERRTALARVSLCLATLHALPAHRTLPTPTHCLYYDATYDTLWIGQFWFAHTRAAAFAHARALLYDGGGRLRVRKQHRTTTYLRRCVWDVVGPTGLLPFFALVLSRTAVYHTCGSLLLCLLPILYTTHGVRKGGGGEHSGGGT